MKNKKLLQESTGPGRYIMNTPGSGSNPLFMLDPHIRLQKWGGNLMGVYNGHPIDIESDLKNVGRKLSEKWAVSGLLEYRTTILDNFNDPGYLDLGIGATWTPLTNLVVVIHPLNYNFVFADDDTIFNSSMGAKIVADYTASIGKVNLKSNFSTFQSYEDSDLSNWTWINSFSYTLWKNFGVGFDFGLRSNKQEAVNYAVNTLGDTTATFDNIDNDLQSYYTFGVSYKF